MSRFRCHSIAQLRDRVIGDAGAFQSLLDYLTVQVSDMFRDPTYYPAKQLDIYPQPVGQIRLDYPESAASAKVDGRLVVLLLIDEFGIVNDASIVEAQPEGYFEDAALAVFRGARFSPGQKQGRAVKSRVLLQVKYLYGQSAGALR